MQHDTALLVLYAGTADQQAFRMCTPNVASGHASALTAATLAPAAQCCNWQACCCPLPPSLAPAPGDSAVPPCSSPSHKQFERAKNSAAGHLARRPHSRQELERKLHEKGHDAKAVQQALERLAELVSSRTGGSGALLHSWRGITVLCGLLLLVSNKPYLSLGTLLQARKSMVPRQCLIELGSSSSSRMGSVFTAAV